MVEQLEVILHSLANIFVDDLGILPSPFRIEVGIADQVKGGLLAQIGLLGGCAKTAVNNCGQDNKTAANVAGNLRIVTLQG